MVQATPIIVLQNRLRGTLGNPIRIMSSETETSFQIQNMECHKYTIDSGDDASLVGHNIWQPLKLFCDDEGPSLTVRLRKAGLYTFNMMAMIDVTDDNRLFAIQIGDEPESPASGGPFNMATATVMGMGSLSYTTIIERPTFLRVWTYGLSAATILNAGDLEYPVLEIVQCY